MVRARAARALGEEGRREVIPSLIHLLEDPDDGVREATAGALGALHATEATAALQAAAARPDGEWARLAAGSALLDLGSTAGVEPLLNLATEGEAKKVREGAARRLRAALPPEAEVPVDPSTGLQATAGWWAQNAASFTLASP